MRAFLEATRGRFFYGWLIVAAAFFVSLVAAGAYNQIQSLFVKPMSEEFGWSRAEFSAATAIGSLAGGILIYFFGSFIDRKGPRLVMVFGSVVLGLSLISLSQISNQWQFYLVFGTGRAMAVGVLDMAAMVAVSNWFLAKRGRAIGITTLGRRFGFALLPLMVQWLILIWGWRAAWVGLGLAVLILGALPSALLVQRRPEDVGLLLDGRQDNPPGGGQDKALGMKDVRRAKEAVWTLSQALRTGAFWLILMASIAQSLGISTTGLHQTPHLTDRGISATAATGVLSSLAVFMGVGALIWGFVAEKVHIRYCVAISFVLTALGTAILTFADNIWMAYAYAAVYGIGLGGQVPLVSIAWADYFGRMSLGSIQGASRPVQMTAAAAGPFFAGWIYDTTGSYRIAFLIVFGAYVMGVIFALLARVPRMKKQEELAR
ncbi:MAG: MFS transporter [Chloroflexi bacterium]|nr:MFS transporter [Chloroflexota bacterium]